MTKPDNQSHTEAVKNANANPKDPQADIEELLVNTGRWGHISCAIEVDPADGFGYCSCGFESEVVKPLTKLFQAHQLELLTELLGAAVSVDYYDTDSGSVEATMAVPVSVINRKIGELNG